VKKNRVKQHVYNVYHQHTKDGVPFGQRHALVEDHKKPATAQAHERTVREAK
jgi:hypothetical protein